MRHFELTARYAVFAIFAVLANLAVQRAVIALAETAHVYFVALVTGTAAGLLVKYFLDKRWIFADPSTDLAAHAQKFSLYTLMGLATTAIFWGTESLFWFAWRTTDAREAGAIFGLAIGYAVKFRLDQRYVFADEARRSP